MKKNKQKKNQKKIKKKNVFMIFDENRVWHHQNDQKNVRNWMQSLPGWKKTQNEGKQGKQNFEKKILKIS